MLGQAIPNLLMDTMNYYQLIINSQIQGKNKKFFFFFFVICVYAYMLYRFFIFILYFFINRNGWGGKHINK
jgi:hypothetical protein